MQEAETNEWSALIKVAVVDGVARVTDEQLAAVSRLLEGEHGLVSAVGEDVTVRTWVTADSADAASTAAWAAILSAFESTGIEVRAIRSHTAEPAQRVSGFLGTADRVHEPSNYSALIKGEADRPLSDADRSAALNAIPGTDKTLAGSGALIVARFWVTASDMGEALDEARRAISAATSELGVEFDVTRVHVASAAARRTEIYPGVLERVGQE